MSKLLLCDGDWILSGSAWECSGAVTQAVFSAPVDYTASMVTEAVFHGFSVTFPVMALAWGARQVLRMVR